MDCILKNRLTFQTLATLFATLISGSAACADVVQGKSVFARCAICHSVVPGGPSGIGPNLYGVVDRKAGSLKGYNYSSAMVNSGIVWNDESLTAYLPAPRVKVPGTKMTYNGLKNPVQLKDLIAYLASLKN